MLRQLDRALLGLLLDNQESYYLPYLVEVRMTTEVLVENSRGFMHCCHRKN